MLRVFYRLLLGTAVVGGLGLALAHKSALAKPVRRVASQNDESLPMPAHVGDRLMGNATCASMSCHHVNGPRGSPRSEYTTWAGYDKHAQAFQVLYDERSERIARNLYGKRAHAFEQQLCLNCHSMKYEKVEATGPRFSLADGIGCESCHGAADRWLTTHYQAGFHEQSDSAKAALGMLPTKDLVVRAQLCAECHIGNLDKNMEVNHDLIAAGHPRLSFEYSGYLHMVARHWLLTDEKARNPDFQARVWAIGQVVSARAAVDQLRHRAEAAHNPAKAGRPWPEFTEYDCFACHKDLKVESARQTAGYQNKVPGSLPFGTWYLPLTDTYARLAYVDLDKSGGSLSTLTALMEKPGAPPGPVAEHASRVLAALDQWLVRLRQSGPLSKAEIRRLLEALAAAGRKNASTLDWDKTAQYYLALAALNEGLGDLDPAYSNKALRKDLHALGEKLQNAFTPGYDSPRRFNPLSAPTLEKQFKAIRDHLGN